MSEKIVATSDSVMFDVGVTFDVRSGLIRRGQVADSTEAVDPVAEEGFHADYTEAVPQLQLSLTYACNMSCSYCSFRQRMREDGRPTNMPLELAYQAINFFKDSLDSTARHARIDFGLTGETMLRRHVHETLMNAIREAFVSTPLEAVWAGPNVTNGTLSSTPEIAEAMGPPQDISCDGPREVHDEFRTYVGNKGTYDDLVEIIKVVLKKHPGIGASAVLTARHTNFVEIFLHLHDELGFTSIYMKPVNVSPDVSYGLNADTLPHFERGYTELVDFLLSQPEETLLRYLLAINPEDYFMRFFYRVKDRSRQLYRCGAGKSGAFVDTDGKLYPCAHFIGKSGWDIGSVQDGFNETKRNRFRVLQVDTREPCKACWARYLCGGGCYYQAVLTNGDIESPDAVKCELIRHLSAESVRLFATLKERYPQVLDALPAPFYVREEYLDAPPTRRYYPSAELTPSAGAPLELITSRHVQGALVPDASARVSVVQRLQGPEIVFSWDERLQLEAIRLWFVDLESPEFQLGDLATVRPEIRGELFRVDRSGALTHLLRAQGGPVRAVPYELPVWEDSTSGQVRFTQDGTSIQFDLDAVFRGAAPQQHYGLNAFLDFRGGGFCSLVRYEPFCLVRASGDGPLAARGGEFEESLANTDELNASPAAGMHPLGRLRGVHANVC